MWRTRTLVDMLFAVAVVATTTRHAYAHGWMGKPAGRQMCDGRHAKGFLQSGGNGNARAQNPRSSNGGVPGFCGDPYSTDGPTVTNFVEKPCSVQATYTQGSTIEVQIELTAQHGGPMEFSLCDSVTEFTEECFESNKLTLKNGDPMYWIQSSDPPPKEVNHDNRAVYNIELQLPQDFSCEHCVLMWTWWTTHVCGFNCDPSECGDYSGSRSPVLYGTEKKLKECPWKPKLRESPQMFRNCADVSVLPNGSDGAADSPSFSSSTSVGLSYSSSTSPASVGDTPFSIAFWLSSPSEAKYIEEGVF